jgi:hypothetical protein
MSKKPPIFRIKTVSRPVPERKTNELLAVGFANDAKAYIGAAHQLEDFSSFGPRYFLFCHALELLLKAQILATGADQEELFEIRHDLEKAYDRAIRAGGRSGEADRCLARSLPQGSHCPVQGDGLPHRANGR